MRTLNILHAHRLALGLVVMAGLSGCGDVDKAVAHVQADAIAKQAPQEAPAYSLDLPPEAAAPFSVTQALPPDLPEAEARLKAFEAAAERGEDSTDQRISYTRFTPGERLLDRYPLFVELGCYIDEEGQQATSWCAHGRMGEAGEEEVAQHVPYLLNGDVLALEGRVACTRWLCLNGDGTVAGALQPAMWRWLGEHCEFHVDALFECE